MAIIDSIAGEARRYRSLAEEAIAQLDGAALSAAPPGGGNSIATICWHVSGNLRSRFTDFLTSDGEKPWRRREEEFEPRSVTRGEVLARLDGGWAVLFATLDTLTDDDLERRVIIRGQELFVREALLRALAHLAYHVGQIVYAAKTARGEDWKYLSIAPGQSDQYNERPTRERPPAK
jgi:uncharacterized damage-inducible protein DinB